MPYVVRYTQETVLAEYEGFSPWNACSDRIVVVVFDGEAELYSVDDDATFSKVTSEINRKYRDDYSREPESVKIFVNILRAPFDLP
jgi:hypothetical protein